jgi:protein-S-isoprenylcysteine O-methyltransferase Ste14
VLYFFRHLLSIALLPFSVTVLIPYWIARQNGTTFRPAQTPLEFTMRIAAVPVFWIGFALFLTSVVMFFRHGRGTLAPWDPPRKLVVKGPYRYVRNPMISGVIIILSGESLILMSWPHFSWALIFFSLNAFWIPLFEEPILRQQFGENYRDYCAHVPRLIPRLRPWSPGGP